MAKVKGLALTNYVGRVGRVVYSMNKGQNIARELQTEVSNPRTTAQMDHRTKLANFCALYRLNQPWMFRGAFENKGKTLSDYNAFVQANLTNSEVALSKQDVNLGACVLAPVTITKGTLPSIQVQFTDISGAQALFSTDLYVGSEIALDDCTIGELSQALLDNNNGLQVGDQLSFIVNYQRSNGDVPYGVSRWGELIIDPTDDRALGDIDLPGLDKTEVSGRDDALQFAIKDHVCAVACILSREVNGKIKVSTQKFVLSTEAAQFTANYTGTTARRRAAASYGSTRSNFLSAGYGTSGTNESVPLAAQILSVNGKTAGQEPPTLRASENTIVFTSPVTTGNTPSQPPIRFYYEGNSVNELGNIDSGDGTASISFSMSQYGSNFDTIKVATEEYGELTIGFSVVEIDDQTE